MNRKKMSIFDPIKSATEMVKKVHVSGVLASFFWLLPFLVGSLVVVSFNSNHLVQNFLMWIIAVIGFVLLIIFVYILRFRDPNLLRSETHIFNMKRLELLGDQRHTFKDFTDFPGKNNPKLPDPKDAEIPILPNIKPTEENNNE